MNQTVHHDMPLFLQIKQHIEDMIVNRSLDGGEQIPSSTQMVKFFQVNHLTVLKGMNLLVDEGIIYKKRGVGMFVSDDARKILLNQRRERLASGYILPLLREAETLEITREELKDMIDETQRKGEN